MNYIDLVAKAIISEKVVKEFGRSEPLKRGRLDFLYCREGRTQYIDSPTAEPKLLQACTFSLIKYLSYEPTIVLHKFDCSLKI